MRHLRYLPLTFLVGIEGFVLFLPYMMLLGAIFLFWRFARGTDI